MDKTKPAPGFGTEDCEQIKARRQMTEKPKLPTNLPIVGQNSYTLGGIGMNTDETPLSMAQKATVMVRQNFQQRGDFQNARQANAFVVEPAALVVFLAAAAEAEQVRKALDTVCEVLDGLATKLGPEFEEELLSLRELRALRKAMAGKAEGQA